MKCCGQTSAKLCNAEISVFFRLLLQAKKDVESVTATWPEKCKALDQAKGRCTIINAQAQILHQANFELLRLQDRCLLSTVNHQTIMSVQPHWVKDHAWVLHSSK